MPMSQEQLQVQELVTKGRTQGYLTHEEVNRVLPSTFTPEDLDELLTTLKLAGIRVVDKEDAASTDSANAKEDDSDSAYRTNDPVRVYLRRMGSVSLLTREGEVEIAKRIESGLVDVRNHVLDSPIAVKTALHLIDCFEKRSVRLKDLVGEPPEGVIITEDRGAKLLRLVTVLRKLDRERRKTEERLAGIQPMRLSYRKQLITRVKNLKVELRENLIEMDLVKRVIDTMATRIKILHHRAISGQSDIDRVVKRTRAKKL